MVEKLLKLPGDLQPDILVWNAAYQTAMQQNEQNIAELIKKYKPEILHSAASDVVVVDDMVTIKSQLSEIIGRYLKQQSAKHLTLLTSSDNVDRLECAHNLKVAVGNAKSNAEVLYIIMHAQEITSFDAFRACLASCIEYLETPRSLTQAGVRD